MRPRRFRFDDSRLAPAVRAAIAEWRGEVKIYEVPGLRVKVMPWTIHGYPVDFVPDPPPLVEIVNEG